MIHRVALYNVQVRPKRKKERRILGDIDEAGTSLAAVLGGYLDGTFASQNDDQTKEVRIVGTSVEGDDLKVTATHGKSGTKAQVVDENDQFRFELEPTDSQLVQCACLFRLPPTQKLGWLAIHINNGQGIKGLLESGIQDKFRHDQSDLILTFNPYVERSVLDKAIEEDKIERVKLIKFERPSDQAMAITNDWIPTDAIGKIELTVSARTRGKNVVGDRLKSFLGHEQERAEIIQFEGVEFDEAKVEVSIDGGQRTFNIEKLESGHPFTEDLEDLDYVDEEPTTESLFSALSAALDRVS